ncbi:hypothetical protein PF005_g26091 [Phytophthora fragariae]|uniref:DDE Tnp4 domain-containing protein n=1 Tax=Phytophthora fragariae TaxID=53985 RepID=A0A6A3DQ82_9STRA|nr:hypothetical protein PF009_g27787 [Phytophthora fragariae]KAE9173874.1 hypothetical protein PF005_g26091 [Phytophthora fragariae]
MTADEILLLCALLEDTGCSDAMVLMLEALYRPLVERPVVPNIRFCITATTDVDAEFDFRFDVAGILQLVSLFELPEWVTTKHRDCVHKTEALFILLHRLSYPKRLADMHKTFGRSEGALSRIVLHMVEVLFDRYEESIYFHKHILQSRIAIYADAINQKGAPMANIFGFIDGTKNAIYRPSPCAGSNENLQRQVYSGHKRVHCLNCQCITTPDGLALHFWGLIEGRRHDVTLLRESKLLNYFEQNQDIFGGYAVYGDPAYGISRYIVSGFRGASTSTREKAFKSAMSSVRESVEWSFGRLKTLWAIINFKKSNKIRLSPVGKYVMISMLMTNCHCCYYKGNPISSFFALAPPSL